MERISRLNRFPPEINNIMGPKTGIPEGGTMAGVVPGTSAVRVVIMMKEAIGAQVDVATKPTAGVTIVVRVKINTTGGLTVVRGVMTSVPYMHKRLK
jgi:hypothetical protein